MRLGTVKGLEWLVAGVVVLALAAGLSRWVLEGVVHSRKTQTVPDLKGLSLAASVDKLAPLNLGLRKEASEFDASVPVQAVLRQNPPPGTVVREGKIVRVVISQGGETVFAPSLAGLPLRNAEMMLRQAQLVLGEVSESYSLSLMKGMVMSQNPAVGASVERGSAVNLSVSGGEPPEGVLLMPDFSRKNAAEASAWALSSQIRVSISTDPTSLLASGTILTQVPPPDTALTRESRVTLVVSGRPARAGEPVASAGKVFRYELSQGGSESLVRIVVSDKYGERELYNAPRKPGSKIDIPISDTGGARVKIYVNGILVEERDL